MHRLVCCLVCSAGLAGLVRAGLPLNKLRPAARADAATAATALPSLGPYRKLVPGVMQRVEPERELEETFDTHNVVELLAVDKTFDWARTSPSAATSGSCTSSSSRSATSR